MPYGINGTTTYGYNNQYAMQQRQQAAQNPQINNGYSIYQQTPAAQQAQPQGLQIQTADNKDDGKIGFLSATGNFLKGVWNIVKSPFTDSKGDFSLGNTLKTIGIGALVSLIPGGPAIALAAGTLFGGVGLVRGIHGIATAKSDAQDAAAWQDLGGSIFSLALSYFGIKQYGKYTLGNGKDSVSLSKSIGQVHKDTWSTLGKGWHAQWKTLGSLRKDGLSATWQKIDTKLASHSSKYKFISDYARANGTTRSSMNTTLQNKWNNLKLKDAGANFWKNNMKGYAGLIGAQQMFGTSYVSPDLMSSLSPEEQQYLKSLPPDVREQFIQYYYATERFKG